MNIKNIILGVIIAVVFLMFCVYGTKLVYHGPDYNRYCPSATQPYNPNENQSNCEKNNGTWIVQNGECIKAPCPQGYCDYYAKCQPNYENANKDYAKNLFIISLIFSIIVIGISVFLINVSSVAGGLMLGSLMYLIYGTGSYWGYMDDWLRFIILGIALVVLVGIGYWLAKKKI